MQTLLIGIDAACFEVLSPLFEDEDLPNLKQIFSEGASGRLKSQIPPWTASAWPSLYTGMNPGKHGVFDFLRFEGYDWDIVNSTDIRQRTIWEYVDEGGMSSVVVNAPVTNPPPEIEGAIVPGYLASDTPVCHPPGLLEEIQEEVGNYRVYASHETDQRAEEEKFDEYLELTRLRGETFNYLANKHDPEFGFIQFQKTDAVFHDYPGDQEKVYKIYSEVDRQIGTILDEHKPETVIVASDHGIGPYDGFEFRANQFLKDENYVETTTGGRGVPSWFQIKDQRLTKGGEVKDNTLETVAELAAKFGITYQIGKKVLEKVGLADIASKYIPVSAVFAASESVDFTESSAYLRSPSELGIRINLEGRDPNGVVSEANYEQVRQELIKLLSDLRSPDGKVLFEEVVQSEEYIHGTYSDEAVDILCIPNNFEHSLSSLINEEFGDPEPYNHKPYGVVAITKKNADRNRNLDNAHLFDIAPTVLASLDISPNSLMDGAPLAPVQSLDTETYPDYTPRSNVETNDEEVAQRLSDLGYLE